MRVGIIGAGITGLALHHYLCRHGSESIVFEAAGEPGGVIRSIQHEGRTLDLGPQRTRLTPQVMELIEVAGIEDRVIRAPALATYVYRDGKRRRVPTTVRGAITTDLLSWRGKLRALLEPVTSPPRAGETVQEYLTRAFGREVADFFIGPLYGGLYGTHPANMYVEHSLSRALETIGVSRSVLIQGLKFLLQGGQRQPIGSFEAGLQELPRGLYDAYRETVELETPVTRIERESEGFLIETESGSVSVDSVIVTTPPGEAAALLDEIDASSAHHLRQLNYNPFAVVHLHSDAELNGAGVQIPFTESYTTLGCTWNACLFDRDGVYTCYLGGAKSPTVVDRPEEELAAIAAREFGEITGYDAHPIHVHRLRPGMPAYDTSWTAFDAIDPPDGVFLCANYAGRAGIPGRVKAARRIAERLAGSG